MELFIIEALLRHVINFLTSHAHHTTERFSFDLHIELPSLYSPSPRPSLSIDHFQVAVCLRVKKSLRARPLVGKCVPLTGLLLILI